ncbi:hypothetical protein SEA_LASTHOPE_48 [Mycobacterium phage LastHope]|uniref:Uncharacterized protein n=1 Tax=Mycobacterium phage LastHope TaxID=2015886 RepID=A0A222ZR48_9CAUD|nr:hypothetical protein I5G99_gp060 [Mycobacterium phage LastHope]ASR87216.1 hypothetical protein SEA_LASTHOPE_48 [Mycobacterium phage LastHope]
MGQRVGCRVELPVQLGEVGQRRPVRRIQLAALLQQIGVLVAEAVQRGGLVGDHPSTGVTLTGHVGELAAQLADLGEVSS